MGDQPSEHDLLTAFLADRDVACPTCGYNLRGLTTHVCPECAAPIYLGVGMTEPLWRFRWLAATTLGAIAAYKLFAAGMTVWVALVPPGRLWGPASYVFGLVTGTVVNLAIGTAAAIGFWRLIRRWRSGGGRPVVKAVILIMWLALIGMLAAFTVYGVQLLL